MLRPSTSVGTSFEALDMRALDVLIAALALLAFLPLLGLCGILILLLSPGPIFFKQVREGHLGRPLTVFKLRTMHVDSESRLKQLLCESEVARREWTERRALTRDPRVIPILGAFMRRFSVDESPQFWNILKGDMAIVGPRPFELAVVERFPDKYRARRTAVRPGLTGLFQVSGRKQHSMRRALAYDMIYLRRRSALFDIYILLKTPAAVIFGFGAQ